MPATPKSPRSISSKKPNPMAKPKGAVRAKSGCYTCRIRRKKCDERRIGEEHGPCETCIRLKLECLGFGAKRPDWLRDSHRVAEIRDRIKAHLAAQGMIKGHAGSGSRNPVQEELLRLSDYHGPGDTHRPMRYNSGTSSSGGSPGREESIESDHPYMGHRHLPLTLHPQMSSVRTYGHPYDGYHAPDMISSRCDSPSDSPMHPYEYPDPPDMYAEHFSNETPATRSSLSLLYHAQFTIDPEFETEYDPLFPNITMNPPPIVPAFIINLSMHEYVNNVVKIQYLLGDKNSLPDMIWKAVNSHAASQEAVNMLSQLYFDRQQNRDPTLSVTSEPFNQRIDALHSMLEKAEAFFSADDAMAALHVVSLYLFDGGAGRWNEFLRYACDYAQKVLDNTMYFDRPSALEGANLKDQFVVKTAIWFDVLASITTRHPPRLLTYIRELFAPNRSYVGLPPTYSMMSPMGCENAVVWALAETSDLSCWKRKHERTGDLSVRELVYRVQEIEPYLQPGPQPIRPQDTTENWSRYQASEIFRTSTKLFLKSVESGDFPHVQEIRRCVDDAFKAIIDPMRTDGNKSAVARNTVFGSYICGSLMDNPDHMRELMLHLEQNSGSENVGNCTNIARLLQNLWGQRTIATKRQPVPWRKWLKENQVLLV